jgi:hypothetical protein
MEPSAAAGIMTNDPMSPACFRKLRRSFVMLFIPSYPAQFDFRIRFPHEPIFSQL